jgi:hypothetical protein
VSCSWYRVLEPRDEPERLCSTSAQPAPQTPWRHSRQSNGDDRLRTPLMPTPHHSYSISLEAPRHCALQSAHRKVNRPALAATTNTRHSRLLMVTPENSVRFASCPLLSRDTRSCPPLRQDPHHCVQVLEMTRTAPAMPSPRPRGGAFRSPGVADHRTQTPPMYGSESTRQGDRSRRRVTMTGVSTPSSTSALMDTLGS